MVSNWEEKFLDELCIKISAGGDKPNSFSKIKTDKLNIPVYSNGIELNGLQGYTDKATITENAVTISARGTIGFICKRLEPYCPIVRLISVIPKDDIYLDFLYYALHLMICNNSGSSIPQLTVPQLKKNKIKYPKNIDEQKRIAAKLDNAFQKIEALENNTKENIKNIEDLYNSYLNRIFTENTDDWEEKTLEDIISKEKYSIKRGPFGSSLRKEFFVENGIRVFEQYNPINNDPNWCRYRITKEKYEELKAFTCKAGDFLISCSGTMGKIVFLPEGTEEGIINQALLKIRLNNDIVDNNFFMYLFQSPYFQNKIFSSSKGSAIQNISSVKDLKKITFLLPTLKEQKKIVDKLDIFNNKIQTIKQNYQNKITLLDNLKKSILNKAFKGEL